MSIAEARRFQENYTYNNSLQITTADTRCSITLNIRLATMHNILYSRICLHLVQHRRCNDWRIRLACGRS